MKIVIAIDSFKGSVTSLEAGEAVKKGILRHDSNHEVIVKAVADGGEGTVDAIVDCLKGAREYIDILNPLNQKVRSYYGIVNEIAVIEVALTSGITMVKEKNILKANTFGLGEMIKDAIKKGYRKFIIGLGGSATNDGGMGMLEALGYQFYDCNKKILKGNGENLIHIHSIDCTHAIEELKDCKFKIASDVSAVLCGKNGASAIFGPQKGATQKDVEYLDSGLENFAKVVKQINQTDFKDYQGAGAAGGLGFCFMSFFNSEIFNGMSVVNEITKLENDIASADLVITGEGKMDGQTKLDKAPLIVSKIAKKYNAKTIALAGQVEQDAYLLNRKGIDAVFSIVPGVITLDEAMNKENTKKNLENIIYQIMNLL